MTLSDTTPPDDSESAVPDEEQLAAPPTPPGESAASSSEAEMLYSPPSPPLVVPPEEQLTAPQEALSTEDSSAEQTTPWLVVALNRRVNRDWEALLLRAPENARRCYENLSTAPMVKKPRRVFPLKGKRYSGAWEYEVTSSERVFYVPDEEKHKVLVYYAGKHPKAAPTPP